MASHTVLQEAHPFCGTHWNSLGRKNNGMSPHGCRMKKEGCFLFFLFSFSKAQVFWQTTQSMDVCVCVLLSVHLYCPLPHRPWSLKRTVSSKRQYKKKTHQNKSMFAKLWEMLSGDLLTFVTFLVLPGNTGKKAEWQPERFTAVLKEINKRLYHRGAIYRGCRSAAAAHFCWFIIQ